MEFLLAMIAAGVAFAMTAIMVLSLSFIHTTVIYGVFCILLGAESNWGDIQITVSLVILATMFIDFVIRWLKGKLNIKESEIVQSVFSLFRYWMLFLIIAQPKFTVANGPLVLLGAYFLIELIEIVLMKKMDKLIESVDQHMK